MDRTPPDPTILKEQGHSLAIPALKLAYRPELDGLRGISILLVCLRHFYYPFSPGGFLGLDIFFVLSGFLITSLLLEEWSQGGSISLKNFYIRRVLRLMPSLFSLILISGGFVLIFLDKEWALKTYQGIWLTLSFASNWLYALEYFSMENPLGITWSLAIEGQFYLVWPVILSLALRIKLRRCWILYILALSIAIIPLHRKILVEQGASVFRLYYGSDTRADALLIGCLVSFLVLWNLLPDNKGVKILLKSLALVAVIFLGYMVGTASWDDLMLYHRGGYTLVALSIGTILTVLIVWPPKVALLILKSAPLVWIGRISYGLYLWHWPVRAFIRNMNGPSGAQKIVAVVILSLMLPALSYYLIEKPFLRRKKRFHSI